MPLAPQHAGSRPVDGDTHPPLPAERAPGEAPRDETKPPVEESVSAALEAPVLLTDTAPETAAPPEVVPAPPESDREPQQAVAGAVPVSAPADGPDPGPEATPGTAAATLPLVEAAPLYARNAPPPYPRLALERGWQGEVLLRVAVAADGAVRSLDIERSSGHPLLDAAARRAVRRWRFRPARRGELPVAAEVRVPVRFELRSS